MPDKDRAGFFFFATKLGVVKRVATEAFKNVRKNGVAAIGLKPKDILLWVKRTTGTDEIAQMTKNGQVILYNESEARAMGRSAAGVRGMRLKGDDQIIETTVLTGESEAICVISKNGIGKKVDVKEFRNQHRGGSGIRIAKLTPKTGLLAGGTVITKQSRDLIIVSDSGQVIRIPITSVKKLSRQASGVILMRSSGSDKVVSLTVVSEAEETVEAGVVIEAEPAEGKKK
ncbi:MAG: DNA gyrase C-terminal beta-propeller domain-containing protein [Patescibacteria group bacterium]